MSLNFSNLKGRHDEVPSLCQTRQIGQWSEPTERRIVASADPTEVTMVSETRNLSSLKEIYFAPTPSIIQSEETIGGSEIH